MTDSTDDDIDDFLEHFGVKGMKWGVRNKAKEVYRPRGRSAKGDKKRKAAAVAGGVAGWVIGGKLARPVARIPFASIAASGASAVLGAKVAATVVDKNRNKKVSEIKS